jgi:hypothetical protein
MNMRKQFSGIVFLILSALALFPAQAEEEHQNLPASIEKRLQSFDPAAVAAARHYCTSPLLKASFTAMIPEITEAMGTDLERANPGLDPEEKRVVLEVVQEAVTTRLGLIIDMTMIAVLEVLSKDELIALDQFYSSPVGQSVINKMPQAMNRLPAMMQVLTPLMLDDLRAKIKAKGMDLRL